MTEEALRVIILDRFPIMRVSNGSALLYLFMILAGCLVSTMAWFMNYNGETEIATNVGLWKIDLDLISEEEMSLGVALSLSVPSTCPLVR